MNTHLESIDAKVYFHQHGYAIFAIWKITENCGEICYRIKFMVDIVKDWPFSQLFDTEAEAIEYGTKRISEDLGAL